MDFSDIAGMTFTRVEQIGSDRIEFDEASGRKFVMYHAQDCSESVDIESITGDLSDLVGSPILMAEESSSSDNPDNVPVPEYQDSFTWTFYKLATIKGYVDLRWYGSSNGYYSESVYFEEITTRPGAGE